MTESSGSYPDPLHIFGELPLHQTELIGAEWIDHGFRVSPILGGADPCPICDAPNQVCTAHNTIAFQED